jgi:hypothetical protein
MGGYIVGRGIRRGALCALVVAAGGASPAAGQVEFGARLGWNLSSFGDVRGVEVERETATVGGVWASFGRSLALRPEVLFSKREASLVDGSGRVPLSQNFVEVPLLAVLRSGAGVLRPSLYGGMSVSFETDCDTDFASAPDAPDGCEGFFGARTDSPLWGGVAGGALHIGLGPARIGVDARYNHGFTEIAPGTDAHWRYWSVGIDAGIALGG